MKKILILVVSFILMMSTAANALELISVSPDNSVYAGKNVDSDKEYIKNIAYTFSDKYVIEELKTADIKEIDKFYETLNAPAALKELDSGNLSFNQKLIEDENLKKNLKLFKLFGGLGGYKAEFEPLCYYKIHRDITLVGGYSVYSKTYTDPLDAYWIALCRIEDMTREVIEYDTRMLMVEKFKSLNEYVSTDNSFKIFILKEGKINSVWENKGIDFIE